MNPRTLHMNGPRPKLLNGHIDRLAVNEIVITKPRNASCCEHKSHKQAQKRVISELLAEKPVGK